MRFIAGRTKWATFLLIILATAACRSDGDRLKVPTPDSDQFVAMRLTCLYSNDIDDIVIGGYLTRIDGSTEAILLRTENGGERWARIGSETFNFSDFTPKTIHYNDALRGWVAGVRSVDGITLASILRTDDGGGHWRESIVPHSRAVTVTELTDLRFDSDDIGFVTVHFVEGADAVEKADVYATTDAGKSWVIKDFGDPKADGPTDTAEIFVSEAEGFRLDLVPLENGTQILYFTGTRGQTWVPKAQFHLSQLPTYY